MLAEAPPRLEMFRLFGDADRLRLLALCADEELSVSELAALMGESQPQITKKSQPLRDAGLLHARKDGTRTLLKTAAPSGAVHVWAAALDEGRALCTADGSLSRVAAVVLAREERARRVFDDADAAAPLPHDDEPAWSLLPLLGALLPARRLAVDVGAGEGAFLPLLSPLYTSVIALDRSPARLARSAALVSARGLPNVRLLEGGVDDAPVMEAVQRKGGANLLLLARVLRYAARPQEVVAAAARLAAPGGHVALVDALPHDDERARERGAVWLGFSADKLASLLAQAGLALCAQGGCARFGSGADDDRLHFAIGQRADA